MAKYQAVIFDFDGTLVDSGPGIVLALRLMLEEMGHKPMSDAELRACVGPPIHKFFPEVFGFEGETLTRAVEAYRRIFEEKAVPMLRAYPGVKEMLAAVRRANMPTGVATCKLQHTCEEQAETLGLLPHLDFISGADPEKGLLEKEDILQALLDRTGFDPERCVMVGDRMFDMIGAQAVRMPAIGVLYGVGSKEELSAYNPLYLPQSVEELQALLLSE
ncbi:MAG TPA: HAD hydrolase-like protein [Feifaniaceae bacterium]|nr:HAD hydrolase-like protein [Feifaniaceae bacterium]